MSLQPGVTTLVPTVTASAAYSSGNCVGKLQKISKPGVGRISVKLQSISIQDQSDQKAAMTILFFANDPTAPASGATVADKTAFSWGAGTGAQALFLGKVDIGSADYEDSGLGSQAVATKTGLQLVLETQDQPGVDPVLYAVIVTTGTPTWATTTPLTINFGFDSLNI